MSRRTDTVTVTFYAAIEDEPGMFELGEARVNRDSWQTEVGEALREIAHVVDEELGERP